MQGGAALGGMVYVGGVIWVKGWEGLCGSSI